MLRDYLRLQFFAEDAGLLTTGVPITIDGQPIVLYATLGALLSDGDGLRIALQWMGQGSTKPCFKHWNVMRKGSNRATHVQGYVEISCSQPDAFQRWTDADFNEAIDVVVEAAAAFKRGEINATRLEECQKAFGFRASDQGLLACPQLRAVVGWQAVTLYDWVHTFLADGVLTRAAWLLINQAEQEGIATQAQLKTFLQEEWKAPAHRRRQGRQIWRIFDAAGAKANMDASSIKCSASELVALYGMLRHWVATNLPLADPRIADHVKVFFHASAAVDTLMFAKRGLLTLPEGGRALRAALTEFMTAQNALYGEANVLPKFHWAFDVCDQLETNVWLFDAFVIERLHLRVRAVADGCKNLASYETSVLSGLINDHANRLRNMSTPHGVVGKTAPFPGLAGASVADHAEVGGMRVAVGDFVARGCVELAQVVACAIEGNELFVVGEAWAKVDDLTPHSARWAPAGRRCVWLATSVIECLAWKMLESGEAIVVAV